MNNKGNFMWGTLVHLGTNMWHEEGNFGGNGEQTWKSPASPDMRLDRATWNKYIDDLWQSGSNTIIIDVGDGVVYKSHPEIAVNGAWSREELEEEVARLKAIGFEVIPKLNFSSTHDVWLKDYSHMLATDVYYRVCKDLIDEVCEIFEPTFFHLGMDEEVYENQQNYDYVVIRQNELWWHDLYYFVDCVEKHGARAMMWSDYARQHCDEFIEKCPKSVVQCVWYYFNEFYGELEPTYECRVKPLKQLAEAGFDIFPTGSVEYFDDNLENLTEYCKNNVPANRLLGIMQTTWEAVVPKWEAKLGKGIQSLVNSIEIMNG